MDQNACLLLRDKTRVKQKTYECRCDERLKIVEPRFAFIKEVNHGTYTSPQGLTLVS